MAKETENKEVTSSRDRMMALAQERFPNRRFQIGNAQNAENAQGEAIDNLDDAIMEMLDDYARGKEQYDQNNKKLADLLASDSSSAEFLQRWVETGDPRKAIIEVFGDDLGMSEEAKAGFETQLSEWRERKKANDELNEAASANWEQSLSVLEEWGNAKNLTLEQKRDVMMRLLAITFNGMENKYSAEDFDLALRAINHDVDVESARREGVVTGRNERIAAARRDRSTAGLMPPTAPGGQGGRIKEAKPKSESPWAGIK